MKKVFLIVFVFISFLPNAFADTVGPNDATIFTNNPLVGSQSWTNTTNVQVSDGLYSTAGLNEGKSSYYIQANGFGFNIPLNSTIDGIVLGIQRSKTDSYSDTIRDNSIKLIKGGSLVGNDKAAWTSWPSSNTYANYGGVSDVWGTTLTPADVNDSSFGVAISAIFGYGGCFGPCFGTPYTANIDHVHMTVYYTLIPSSNNASSISLSGTPSGFTFASSTYSYPSVTVPNTQTDIAITASADAGTITVNGETIASGGTSSSTALTAGVAKTIDVVVTESGKTPTTYTITVTRDLSSTKAITSFSFPEGAGVITGTNIAVTVPSGTDVTSLVPTILHTGASLSPVSGLANDFTSATTYTVMAENSSTEDYVVTVTVTAPVVNTDGGSGIVGSGPTSIGYIRTYPPSPAVVEPIPVNRGTFRAILSINLGLGNRGNDVMELQKALAAEGVYFGPLTGYFGNLTNEGVKKYQEKHGIIQTGFVGSLTRAKLNSGSTSAPDISTMTNEQIKDLISTLQKTVEELMARLRTI